MNDFLKHNLDALKTHAPGISSLSSVLSERIQAIPAATGEVTARCNHILLHSAYDPVKEAHRFALKIKPGSHVCLYGFGLGYHVQSLLNQIGDSGFLLVIELNPDLLSAAMILKNQAALLAHKNFHLIFGKEEAEVSREISKRMQEMERLTDSPVEVLFHAPSFKCIPKNFPSLTNALEVLLMERRFPAVLGNLESQNYSLNKEIVQRSPGIASLLGTHSGQPAVLVSAGPSLDDLIPYLKRFADHTLIACVDTALPILAREGILPHYVFTLDPQEESFHHFREHLESPFKLVYTPTAHAKIVSGFRGEKFVVVKKGHSLFQNQDSHLEEKGVTESGGSVSCLGLDCLIQFGCDPIFLAGQDCAYSGKRNYARGSGMNQKLLDQIHQSNTLERGHAEKAGLKKQISIEGIFGEKVFTSQSMFSYKRTIEQIALQHPKTEIINLCPHGADLENIMPLCSVNEAMQKLAPVPLHPGS